MGPIVYVDRSDVLPGRLDELRERFAELAAFVESAVPEVLSYAVHLSENGTRASIVHVHADEASLAHLMTAIRDRLPPFAELLQLRSIEVFGEVGESLRTQLRAKADLLGAESLTISGRYAGFLRGISPSE